MAIPRWLRNLVLDNHNKRCAICGIGEIWNNLKLTLQIDHISGNNKDNRINNLRPLCPNCHTQTDTWGSKNKKNKKRKPKIIKKQKRWAGMDDLFPYGGVCFN